MLQPIFLTAALSMARAGPISGVEWVPGGRTDLAWIESNQLTGTLVAEGDGWIDPSLSAWAGFSWERMALVGSLGLAAHNTVTLQSVGEGETQKTRFLVMGIRPGADLRVYLGPDGPIRAWTGLGMYAVLPVVRYTSDAFSEDEQAAYDELAREDRARILGGGARSIFGVEHTWDPGVGLGFQASWGLHRGQDLDDTVIRVSWRSQIEAAILLSYRL
jgi:hypothetical protein